MGQKTAKCDNIDGDRWQINFPKKTIKNNMEQPSNEQQISMQSIEDIDMADNK